MRHKCAKGSLRKKRHLREVLCHHPLVRVLPPKYRPRHCRRQHVPQPSPNRAAQVGDEKDNGSKTHSPGRTTLGGLSQQPLKAAQPRVQAPCLWHKVRRIGFGRTRNSPGAPRRHRPADQGMDLRSLIPKSRPTTPATGRATQAFTINDPQPPSKMRCIYKNLKNSIMARHNYPTFDQKKKKPSMSDDGPAYTSERFTRVITGKAALLSYHVHIETFFLFCPIRATNFVLGKGGFYGDKEAEGEFLG
jgi:hypothetical protein